MARSVGIIIGSTRPNCNGKVIAAWIDKLIQGNEAFKAQYTLIDLVDWKLPLFNEPGIPMKVPASLDHSKAWSQRIKSLDGFIFVTPQVSFSFGLSRDVCDGLLTLFSQQNSSWPPTLGIFIN